MRTRAYCLLTPLVVLVLSVSASIAWAQAQTQPEGAPTAPGQDAMMQEGMMQDGSAKMEHMADAMASMAQTCETMMKMEMNRMQMWATPLMAAGIAFGVLIAVALVLFIILEVQWIRLLNRRIKSA